MRSLSTTIVKVVSKSVKTGRLLFNMLSDKELVEGCLGGIGLFRRRCTTVFVRK